MRVYLTLCIYLLLHQLLLKFIKNMNISSAFRMYISIFHPKFSVKYRVISKIAGLIVNDSTKLEISLVDSPGKYFKKLTIEEIKADFHIISHLHPEDVNFINDLYYFNKNRQEYDSITMSDNNLICMKDGKVIESINIDNADKDTTKDSRLSFYIGYIKSERIKQYVNSNKAKYMITSINFSSIVYNVLGKNKPYEISIFALVNSDKLKNFSKEDIIKITRIFSSQLEDHKLSMSHYI